MRGLPSGLLHPHVVNRGNPAIQRDRTKCFGQEKGKAGYFIRAYDARTRRCHRSSGRKGKGSIFKTKMLPVTPEQPQFMLRHKSEMLLERFAFKNICGPDTWARPAGFTPPPGPCAASELRLLRRRGGAASVPPRPAQGGHFNGKMLSSRINGVERDASGIRYDFLNPGAFSA